jgi:polyisoprenoid-binding protein YceI
MLMKRLWMIFAVMLLATAAFAQTTYSLSEASEARFYIDEVLLGNPKTVLGTTSVTGEVSFDLANPQTATIGLVTVNARDFATDDNRRNGQIRNRVLESGKDEYQFITFEPTAIAGLPTAAAVGDSFEVNVTGNLTIKGVTKEVVFAVTVTVVSETELQGLGSTVILFEDYDISIPSVPIVASTSDEVKLEIAFNAVAN